MRGCWQLYALQWAALALRGAWLSEETARGDHGDDVISLLEVLNISRSVPGITRTKGPDLGVPAWKFHPWAPHLHLPWDCSIHLLSTVQDALGFHFVARQSHGSEGTLISLESPAASRQDGRPLLQLVSSTRADWLWLEYWAVHSLEPASLIFPGRTPFSQGRWARLALNLKRQQVSLFVDCHEAFVFERSSREDALNLRLPLDLQITFSSSSMDKFLLDLLSVPYSGAKEHQADLPEGPSLEPSSLLPLEPLALASSHHNQWKPSQKDFLPPRAAQSGVSSPEERIRRLEELVDGLGTMLDMVKEQNSDLLGRVRALEGCGCRQLACLSKGRHCEDGTSWDRGQRTSCMCVRGKAKCVLHRDRHPCLGCADGRKEGESCRPEPCHRCQCQDGNLLCSRIPCPQLGCTNTEDVPGECCPRCQGCVNGTARHEHGEEWTPPTDPCMKCKCLEGSTVCEDRPCPGLCRHPAHPHPHPGTCCSVCDGCLWEGHEHRSGEAVLSKDPCQHCTCLAGEVSCEPVDCLPAPCSHPGRRPGQCCPTCEACEFEAKVYQNKETFTPASRGPCLQCQCLDGHVRCREELCPTVPCSQPVRDPVRCCPLCKVCVFESLEFENGAEWEPEGDPCRICTCLQGETVCRAIPCPPASCQHPARLLGTCCPTCHQCFYNQRLYSHGQEFTDPDSPCQSCRCTSGSIHCSPTVCPPLACPRPERLPASCCPRCPGCIHQNRTVPDGEEIPSPFDLCQTCICTSGELSCAQRKCPPPLCAHPLPGSCCRSNCNGCSHSGKEYPNGATFPHPVDPCRQCHCINGHVQCLSRRCPPLLCPEPTVPPGECCPQCPAPPAGCLVSGAFYQHMERFYDPLEKCRHCICANSTVSCQRQPCAPVQCTHPLQQGCCRSCDGCLYQGRELPNGEQFEDPQSPCGVCSCWEGSVTCQPKTCPPVECSFPVSGLCCKSCDGCKYLSERFLNGQDFPDPQDACQFCTCLDGSITCSRKPCFQAACSHPLWMPGQCCPMCHGEAGSVHCAKKLCTLASCAHLVPGPCAFPLCQGCRFQGQDYADAETWISHNNPCEGCRCLRGSVSCLPTPCPPVSCQDPVMLAGECCPKCMGSCRYHGQLYKSGEVFASPQEMCHTCTCLDEMVTCQPTPCPPECTHPVPSDVPACCPLCERCLYEGQQYADGHAFRHPSDPCQHCSCRQGSVLCAPVGCPTLACANPSRRPGGCCPHCPGCQHAGREYPEGSQWLSPLDPCQQCSCRPGGEATCEPLPCEAPLCSHPAPGPCCPLCQDCLWEGVLYTHGQVFQPESCLKCACQEGNVRCEMIRCPPVTCPHPLTEPGTCCPHCKECVIEADGQRRSVSDGVTWKDHSDSCVTCTCHLGHIECRILECLPVRCQEGQVEVHPPGQCCTECQDPARNCSHQGNQRWQADECTTCACVSGQAHCRREHCPPITCAPDETPALAPGVCCPRCAPRPATCVAFGDPHYRTFDGRMIHFQGGCSYVLSQDCKGGDFSIHVTNEDRGRPGVSWTKEVALMIGATTVQLLPGHGVLVDSRPVSLPFLKEPQLYVERKGSSLLLNTEVGVKVLWNGHSHLEVSVPGTYKGHLCGLCGNFNGYPQDDLRMRSGQLSQSEAAFGNSWKVVATEPNRCLDGLEVDPCKQTGFRSRREANARCKVLKVPPFTRCHTAVPPEPFFASCVYDLCACGAARGDACLCEVLEAYARQCHHAGLVLQWRSPTLCAVGCPQERGYVFDECGPPCPKTCFNHAVPQGVLESGCLKPCVPGCQCPAGMVEHDAHCIPPEACPTIIHSSP